MLAMAYHFSKENGKHLYLFIWHIHVEGAGSGGVISSVSSLSFLFSFFPVPLFHLLYYLFYLFFAFLWETTQNTDKGSRVVKPQDNHSIYPQLSIMCQNILRRVSEFSDEIQHPKTW